MASYNKCILMGNLVRDPELRHTPSGAAVCNFDIAVNREYTSGNERKKETTYVTIVAWAKLGEACGKYLEKGSGVLVEGRLQQRTWETPEGQKRSKHEVVAEAVQFLTRKSREAAEGGGGQEDEVPF